MKNVLLLGDSIRLGYCAFVRKELENTARVFYPEENCQFTQYTLVALPRWLNATGIPKEEIDLIHWNNGHWDAAHFNQEDVSLNSPELYGVMLGRICRKLRTLCPNAKIIFALTTPVHPENIPMANPRSNSEIEKYNAVAAEVMEKFDVKINDLYSLAKTNIPSSLYADYCHFKEEGYQILGRQVIRVIRENLNNN